MDFREEVLKLHRSKRGKIEVTSKIEVKDSKDLSLVYTPGVAEPCKEIEREEDLVYQYTNKGNTVAIVTDGSAVLGLGNIGPRAALPVMEGKSILFKEFGGLDAFPICLEGQDVEEIVASVKQISPSFGGINLEDISAPRCFEILARLREDLDIPVFHDDQDGTAIVVLAAIINSLSLLERDLRQTKVVINGAGAAGMAIARILLSAGVEDLVLCNSRGILDSVDPRLDPYTREMASRTNPDKIKGGLREALANRDIFIGVSIGGILTKEDISLMNKDPIILALANPLPEIWPEEAKLGGAKIVATGRSDLANQVNNVLAFPGVFRGALDVRARDISEEMILEAAYALANMVAKEELNEENILPSLFDGRIVELVAEAVSKTAIRTGLARI